MHAAELSSPEAPHTLIWRRLTHAYASSAAFNFPGAMESTLAPSQPCTCMQWGTKHLRRHQVHHVAVSRMCMHCSGAFKFRGAMNSILSLSVEQAAKGVVVHSSGNHAAAVALAAKICKIPAHIVLPTDAPQVGSLKSHTLCCAITVQKGVMPSCLHPCCSKRQRVLSCASLCRG